MTPYNTKRGKDWRETREGNGIANQGTHKNYFIYQLCNYVLGVKFGSPGAKNVEYLGNYLAIKNDAGETVLSGNIPALRCQLIEAKWPHYPWR